MTRDELKQAYTNAFIELVMENTAAAGVDISGEEERAIVIDGLRDAMLFATNHVLGRDPLKTLDTPSPTGYNIGVRRDTEPRKKKTP